VGLFDDGRQRVASSAPVDIRQQPYAAHTCLTVLCLSARQVPGYSTSGTAGGAAVPLLAHSLVGEVGTATGCQRGEAGCCDTGRWSEWGPAYTHKPKANTQEQKDAARLAKNLAQRARKPRSKTQEQKNAVKEKDRLRKRGQWQALTQEQKNARHAQRQLCRKKSEAETAILRARPRSRRTQASYTEGERARPRRRTGAGEAGHQSGRPERGGRAHRLGRFSSSTEPNSK
jgi:hypothetical protein